MSQVPVQQFPGMAPDPPAIRVVPGEPPFDIALVPLVVGLVAAYVVPAAASGVSAGQALAALALGALMSLAFARNPFSADRHTRIGLGLIALLSLWYLATRAWALAPGGSMLEAGRVATFALVVYAGHTAFTRASSRWLALASIGAAGLWVALPEAWQVVRDGAPSVRDTGELGYWNASAIVSLVLVPIAVAMARMPSRLMVAAAGPLCAVAAAAAATTSSRGALAAALLGLAVLVFSSPDRRAWVGAACVVALATAAGVVAIAAAPVPPWLSLALVAAAASGALLLLARRVGAVDRDRHLPRMRRMSVLGVVLSVAIAALVGGLALKSGADRPTASQQTHDVGRLATTDDSLRLVWWRDTLDLWAERRVTGLGGGAFESSRSARVDDFAAHPHSLALQVLVESGIVGIALVAIAALFLVRAALGAPRTPERCVALAIAVMVLAQAAIDWTWSLPQVMAVAALAIAASMPGRSRADLRTTRLALPRRSVLAATLAGILVASTLALVPFAAGMLADQAAVDIDERRYASAAANAERSMTLLPAYDTLQLQVIALELAGRDEAARRALTRAEAIWFTRPDGLLFAKDRLSDDPRWSERIDRQIEVLEDKGTD